MKIALLYSGLPNLTEEVFLNHNKFIYRNYDCDIYLSTYSDNYDDFLKTKNLLSPYKHEVDNSGMICNNFYSIISSITRKRPETNIVNTLSMFYKIQKCFELIDTSVHYDNIIRIRLDIKFDKHLVLGKNSSLNVPKGGDHVGGLLDLFAYGSYDIMSNYCKLYEKIPDLLNDGCLFHPETMLRYHCNKEGLDIYRFPYNIYLRNELFTR